MAPGKKFELIAPPFELDALEPHMSKETMDYHWGKHHNTYVNNVNTLLENDEKTAEKNMEQIMKESWNGGNYGALFNNSAQVWNHDFWWSNLSPEGGGKPEGQLLQDIEKSFGSFDQFQQQFKAKAAPGAAFGSGWVWLVDKGSGTLSIEFTQNAENPIVKGSGNPLIGLDVWEHAYYIDYRNARASFTEVYLTKLVNWNFAQSRYGK